MAIEIERKFLVKGEFKSLAHASEDIVQGYLSSVPERTVRVRIKGRSAFLTIKGKSTHSGLSRYEWEKEISVEDAKELIDLCEPGVIEKTRYYVEFDKQTFEVDVFHGQNEGLVIAELELKNEAEKISVPEWIGEEVTGDEKYYNASLFKKPYTTWNSQL